MKKIVLLFALMFMPKVLFAEEKFSQGTFNQTFGDLVVTVTFSGQNCTISKIAYPKNWEMISIQLINDPVVDRKWWAGDHAHWDFFLTFKKENHIETQIFGLSNRFAISTPIASCVLATAITNIVWEKSK